MQLGYLKMPAHKGGLHLYEISSTNFFLSCILSAWHSLKMFFFQKCTPFLSEINLTPSSLKN